MPTYEDGQQTMEVLRRFALLPAMYNGPETNLDADSPPRVMALDDKQCHAFGVPPIDEDLARSHRAVPLATTGISDHDILRVAWGQASGRLALTYGDERT